MANGVELQVRGFAFEREVVAEQLTVDADHTIAPCVLEIQLLQSRLISALTSTPITANVVNFAYSSSPTT